MSALWADAKRTRVWERVDAETFQRDIQKLNQPAILKGLVKHWPAIAKAQEGPQALSAYVKGFSTEQPVETFLGASEIEGRFSYGPDLKTFNFEKKAAPLSALLDMLLAHIDDPRAPSFYAGAVNVPQFIPGMATSHRLDVLEPEIEQLVSLWIGNRSRTAAHWDLPQNIACIISGRRRYTLLPTAQVKNLYMGPLDFTPAGRAISLVDFRNPDFSEHPRFREAMAAAEIADLEPGDAVYVPSLWFHHVESFDAFSVMMNFWWRDAAPHLVSPQLTMMHALLTLRDLPANERAAWRVLFDHYIFQTDGDPFAHVPAAARGVFGEMSPERLATLKDYLARMLRR